VSWFDPPLASNEKTDLPRGTLRPEGIGDAATLAESSPKSRLPTALDLPEARLEFQELLAITPGRATGLERSPNEGEMARAKAGVANEM